MTGVAEDNVQSVHFDTKTTITVVIASLTFASSLLLWGTNLQERMGIVENQQRAFMDRTDVIHDAISFRINEQSLINQREISRMDTRFDKLDATLIRIEDKLNSKADR